MKDISYKKAMIALVIVVCVAFILRFYKVSTIPPSLSWDEVSIGYNAYSILKTAKDEHGRFLPLDTFIAYGDYKPPFSIYLTVPFVALMGLTELAVRLPSVVFGSLAVILVYALIILITKRRLFGLVTASILALSVWHIQLSRAGFEANIATTILIMGVWLVLKANKHPNVLWFCWLPFVFAVYTFNSARYFAPLLCVGLLFFIKNTIRKNKTLFLGGVIIALVALLPVVPHLLSKEARLRFNEVNIFTDISVVETSNERIQFDNNSVLSKVIHNRRLGYMRSYLVHFFDHFEPWFLFIRGDGNPKFSLQDVGQLYLIELPFLLFGLYVVFHTYPSLFWLMLYWLIAAIVPAAVARETPHALRIENTMPVWQIFIGGGIIGFWDRIKVNKAYIRNSIVIFVVLLFAGNISYYLHNYYAHYAREFSSEWQYGYREAIAFIQPLKESYDEIVMTDVIGRPYAYTLFYEGYDPKKYRETVDASFDAIGFYNVFGFGRYRFVRKPPDLFEKNKLYILKPSEVPSQGRILHVVHELNGTPVLVIFDI